MADRDHYLAGPCEGMSLHCIGREVQFKDTSGREPESKRVFEDEERASAFIWLFQKIDAILVEHGQQPFKMRARA